MTTKVLSLPTLSSAHPLELVAVRVMSGVVLLLIVAYVYGISASTFNIIARKQAESSAGVVRSSLAQLNAEYYTLTQGLTQSRAKTLGLSELREASYVTRDVHVGYSR